MKTFILLIIAGFFTQQLDAESTFDTVNLVIDTGGAIYANCGISYNYDNAGNRVERLPSTCFAGDTDGKKNSATESTDSTQLQNLSESIYPNPTSGNFNVVFNNAINTGQLIITDNLGRQLYKTSISGISVPLNISSLAEGVYYVTIKTGGYSFQNTVVKN
jgi:hypothetical protein